MGSAGTGLMNILSTVMLSRDPHGHSEVQRNSFTSTNNNNTPAGRLKPKLKLASQKIENGIPSVQDAKKSINKTKKKKKKNQNSKIIRPDIKFVSNGKPFN